MVSFLITEREKAGWRFLLFWMLATNLGFFLGIALEFLIVQKPTLYLAVPLAALGQAYVINRHISIYLPWAVGTTIFWIIGAIIAYLVASTMPQDTVMDTMIVRFLIIGAIGGLLAGIPQWIFMRDWLPQIGVWWLVLSAIAWAILIPGLISGIILMRFISQDKIPMEGRHYELSGEY